MLKKCYGLFLGLVVIAGSACVTPTHASSASVIITAIRAGTQASALQEGIVLYNNSSYEVSVSNWCLTNKTQVQFACIEAEKDEQVILPAYSYATIVSQSAVEYSQADAYLTTYESVNHSSGAIVASSDTISLIDSSGQIVDQYSWSTSISSTQQWGRLQLLMSPDMYLDTNSASDWQKLVQYSFPVSMVEYRITLPDNQDDSESPVSEVSEIPNDAEALLPVIITEVLPNAIGSDVGNEFIEVFNPNVSAAISLNGYQLLVGASLEKAIVLGNFILKAGEYKVFTNAEYTYTLLNTSSKVGLKDARGLLVSETPLYASPAEGRAWALIDDLWQFTTLPTPGLANQLASTNMATDEDEPLEVSTVKPCAANQYRSPETNRCRLINSTSSTTPALCKPGQERNPDTGRCKAVAVASQPSACKAGQERNPETNRCKAVKQITKADYAVKGAQNQHQGGMSWYVWMVIAGVVLLVVGYGVWEWRDELKKLYVHIKSKFAGAPK